MQLVAENSSSSSKDAAFVLNGHVLPDKPLSRGASGAVYKIQGAHLPRGLGLDVEKNYALKVYDGKVPQSSDRRYRELKVSVQLSHPSLVKSHFLGEMQWSDRIVPVLLMDFYSGEDLGALRRKSLTEAEVANIGVEISDALQCLHRRRIVHRDVKPANVIATDSGRVVLLDLGVAKVYGERTLTGSEQFMGSLRYASPESLAPAAQPARSWDIYSLGTVLYELMTGNQPFEETTDWRLLVSEVRQGLRIEYSSAMKMRFAWPFYRLVRDMLSVDRGTRPSATDVTSVLGRYRI